MLDVHTTTNIRLDDCIVVYDVSRSKTADIIRHFDIDKVIVMPRDIAAHSLIGNCPAAISLEIDIYNSENIDTIDRIAKDICAMVDDAGPTYSHHTYYYIDGIIAEDDELPADAQNFKQCSLGFYPILIGDKAYQGVMKGFRASRAANLAEK